MKPAVLRLQPAPRRLVLLISCPHFEGSSSRECQRKDLGKKQVRHKQKLGSPAKIKRNRVQQSTPSLTAILRAFKKSTPNPQSPGSSEIFTLIHKSSFQGLRTKGNPLSFLTNDLSL